MFTYKQKLLFLCALCAGLASGGTVSFFQKAHTEVSQSFVVRNQRHAAADVYDYEGFYTLQTANESAKALVSWLTSPGGVERVYAEAGVVVRFKKLRDYERAFSVRRADTPFFEVRYDAKTMEDAQKLSEALEALLRTELGGFQNSVSLSLGATEAVVIGRPVSYARNLVYGASLGLLLALFYILFRRALEAE